MSKRNVHDGKPAKRLTIRQAAHDKHFGMSKGFRKPGSQNRKK